MGASYGVAFIVAKSKKPNTDGESIVKIGTLKIVKRIFGKDDVKRINEIFMSNFTIQRRIEDIALDKESQVTKEIQSSRKNNPTT